jgi:hypothetical protein
MVARLSCVLIVCVFALVGAVDRARGADEASPTAELKFCEKIEKLKPVDPKDSFTYPDTKKVYGWIRIAGGKGSLAVTATWLKDGKRAFKHKINIKDVRYPTWSFKFVTKGSWKLEISDDAGKVLGQGEFTVK